MHKGKEQQTDFDLGYFDYGFRQLDPQLCMWHSPDLLAETSPSASPYSYCSGDPINRTDPTGLKDMPGIPWSENADLYFEFLDHINGGGGGYNSNGYEAIIGYDKEKNPIWGVVGAGGFGRYQRKSIYQQAGIANRDYAAREQAKKAQWIANAINTLWKITPNGKNGYVNFTTLQLDIGGEVWWACVEKSSFVGHFLVYDPYNKTAYETAYCDPNKTALQLCSVQLEGGDKGIGYVWNFNEISDISNSEFINFGVHPRADLLYAPIYLSNADAARAYFEIWEGLGTDFEFLTNNCKNYGMRGLQIGGGYIPKTDNIPINWPYSFWGQINPRNIITLPSFP